MALDVFPDVFAYGVLLVQFEGHGWLEVSVDPGAFSEWESLCRRRDFTCNSIAWDVATAELLDPLGGRADIEAGRLREAGPSSIQADPLRIWRAAQFCARFEWSIDPALRRSIDAFVPELAGLPQERVTREWEKLLVMPRKPGLAVQLLDDWGVILQGYPELFALHECLQEPQFHPEGDVWIHTLMVLDQAARLGRERGFSAVQRLQLGLAALLHDLGKPATTRRELGRITAHGHEVAGVKPARAWFARHSFGEPMELAVLDCVAKHMRPMQLTREIRAGKPRDEALRNLGDRTGVDDIKSLVAMLVQADRFGTSIADSLRVHSDGLRTKRRLRAEEAAAKIGVKLVFPLIFGIFPAMLVVLAGPAVIRIYRQLYPILTGQ